MTKKLLIVGVGEGLGKSLATKFGQQGYELFLIARNLNRLGKMVNELTDQGIKAHAYPADVSDKVNFAHALNEIKKLGPVDGVVYNVGITQPDGENFTRDDLEKHFETDVAGAYQTILTLHDDLKVSHGFALFTGGVAGVQPFPGFLGLGVAKAGLRNLVQLLNQELKEDDIFVGTVTIYGVIKPDTHFAPDMIADKFVDLANKRDQWEVNYQ